MAGIVARKPIVGFATALIFFFLGLLLIQMDSSPGAPKGVVVWMFRVLGGFCLFAAAGSLVVACMGMVSRNKRNALR